MSKMNTKQKQWQLFYLGYYGDSIDDIDGIWGDNSIKATKKFQSDSGIKKDGIFGTNSEEKSKAVIKVIQKKLGGLIVDGLAGNNTMNKTMSYQTENGLTANGRADKDTRDKMDIDMKSIQIPSAANNATNNIINTTINTVINGSTTANTITNSTGWSKYFDKSEFKCKCGGRYCNGYPVEPNRLLVDACDNTREHFGAAMVVTSGIRCSIHNANEGGVSNSRHISGKAVDFYIVGRTADEVLAYVSTLSSIRYCYKINSRCVHMDVW